MDRPWTTLRSSTKVCLQLAPVGIFVVRARGWSGGAVEPNRRRFVVEDASIEIYSIEGERWIGEAHRRGG
jgi:hypothetical protein